MEPSSRSIGYVRMRRLTALRFSGAGRTVQAYQTMKDHEA
jgi:hypothetical protein